MIVTRLGDPRVWEEWTEIDHGAVIFCPTCQRQMQPVKQMARMYADGPADVAIWYWGCFCGDFYYEGSPPEGWRTFSVEYASMDALKGQQDGLSI